MSVRTAKYILDAFFEQVGRLDAPYGQLVDQAFRTHLMPLADEQLPSEVRAEWRHIKWAWLQSESEDDVRERFDASPFSSWTAERQNAFMDKLHDLRRRLNDIFAAD